VLLLQPRVAAAQFGAAFELLEVIIAQRSGPSPSL
jgi:hypothetical protein